jgi:xanthine/CO dehydrogenase XdhC/CoxF family maturation factor
MRDVTEALLAVLDEGGRGALATVIRSSGSTPQEPGARISSRPDGRLVGTVGGGAIERLVVEELRRCLDDAQPRVVVTDLVRDLGMCCGGRMEVFVEPVEGRPRRIVFGAGHVGKAVAHVAPSLGYRVVVVDDREERRRPRAARPAPRARRHLGCADAPLLRLRRPHRERAVLLPVRSGPERPVRSTFVLGAGQASSRGRSSVFA